MIWTNIFCVFVVVLLAGLMTLLFAYEPQPQLPGEPHGNFPGRSYSRSN
jgi:hypothetical protein